MKYAIEMVSRGMICVKFHEDWYRHSSNIKGLLQKFERL
jgi:hypothetical protein